MFGEGQMAGSSWNARAHGQGSGERRGRNLKGPDSRGPPVLRRLDLNLQMAGAAPDF